MEPEVRTAQSIAPCAKHQDIGRNLAHARFASAANARQSDIQHATVADQSQFSRSWYALTVAQKRIERPAATAQSTARCAKHPVMDTNLKDGQEDGLNLGHSPEMLFDLRANNTPPHLLSLAEGDIVFLMRTLDKRELGAKQPLLRWRIVRLVLTFHRTGRGLGGSLVAGTRRRRA